MKYTEIEGKNEETAKVDFVNMLDISCEECNTTCTWEDVEIIGTWGVNAMLVCGNCVQE